MTGPVAMTVHPGGGAPPAWRRDLIGQWLTANGIDPAHVQADAPISIFTVPYTPSDATAGEGPWFIKVIVFTQVYTSADGAAEYDFLKHEPVRFQRTVPLKTPFPADPTPGAEGSPHGQAQRQAAQEAPQEVVRPARQEGLSHPGQGSREVGAFQGETAWNEGTAKAGSGRGDEAVPESEEEVRREPEEEVGGA